MNLRRHAGPGGPDKVVSRRNRPAPSTGNPSSRRHLRSRRAGNPRPLSPLFKILLLALPLLILSPAAGAQPRYTYEAFHSYFQVRADGTVSVRHRVTYRFEDPSGWVGLTVPAELGTVIEARVLDGAGEPLAENLWDLEQDAGGTVLWFDSSQCTGSATVCYQYTVQGSLKVEGESVVLRWPGVPQNRSSPIPESSVTVELPSPVSPGDFQFKVRTTDYKGQVQKRVKGDRIAVAELEGLQSQATYEFTASWPARIMDLSGPGFTSPQSSPAEKGTAENLKSWEFERFDVDITLHPDATFTVRETQVVHFQGNFTYLTREIPTQPAAFEEGRTYGRVRLRDFAVYDLEGNPLDRGAWKLKDVDGGKKVTISFQATDQTLGWIIEYRVSGAIIFAPEYDRLYWNAVSQYREAKIASSLVTLRLPQGADPEAVNMAMYVDPYMPPSEWDHGKEGDLLWWRAENVSPFTTFTLDAAFPKGLVEVPWAFRRTAGMVGIASGAAVLLGTLAFMLALWWWKGRDVGSRKERVVRYDPPEGLSPAVVGVLVRQVPETVDITATIVDLARRGYLTIFEEEKRKIIRRRVFGFQRLDRDHTGLLAYEKSLLNKLFESQERVTEEDLEYKFHAHLRPLKDAIMKEAMARKLFAGNPLEVRVKYMFTGWGLIGLAALLYYLLPRWLDLGWLWVPVLSLAPSGLVVWAVGWAMPRRTKAGSRAYAEALGFKEYLATAEKPELEHMTPEYFERNLPYAMVLGVVKQWARKFEGLYEKPPSWFVTTDSARGPLSLGLALESMNGSLSHTFSSSPSSGGSGGGFGGGSSGGGFGGGGSSAG